MTSSNTETLLRLIELAKRMSAADDWSATEEYELLPEAVVRVLPALERLLAGQQGWIACSERMPCKRDEVAHDIMFVVDGKVHMGHHVYDSFCAEDETEGDYEGGWQNVYYDDEHVTHWMPLPPAPTGG